MEKRGVIRFFRELSLKKCEVMCFSGSYSLKNGDTWLFRENFEKNGVIAFFLVLV